MLPLDDKALSLVVQGPFSLQDFQAWVGSGHFVDSMQVYHIADTSTAYTLGQLFTQLNRPHPPSEPQPPLPSPSDPSLGPYSTQNVTSAAVRTSSSLQRYQQHHGQQEDLLPKVTAIAEQLRQQLLESGKKAVYELLKKSVYSSLPGILEIARGERAAEAAREAAREAAEAARREVEVRAAAAESARLKAEAEAKALADKL